MDNLSFKTIFRKKNSILLGLAFVAVALVSSNTFAFELSKTSKFNFASAFDSCGQSNSGNSFCWDKQTGTQTQISLQEAKLEAVQTAKKIHSFGERMVAAGLGLIMQFTSSPHSFADSEVE
jgi:hypothetical protein